MKKHLDSKEYKYLDITRAYSNFSISQINEELRDYRGKLRHYFQDKVTIFDTKSFVDSLDYIV